MLVAAQGLDRGAQDVDLGIALAAGVKAEAGLGANAQEGAGGLVENFFAVGDEKNAPGLRLLRIEGGQPGFSQPGRQYHQTTLIALQTGVV